MLSRPIIRRLDLPATGLNHGKVLSAFESLRRQIAESVCDSPGAFAGYDRLELLRLPDGESGRVVASAVLIADTGKALLIGYEAAFVTNELPPRRSAVALGSGRTVGLAARKWRA